MPNRDDKIIRALTSFPFLFFAFLLCVGAATAAAQENVKGLRIVVDKNEVGINGCVTVLVEYRQKFQSDLENGLLATFPEPKLFRIRSTSTSTIGNIQETDAVVKQIFLLEAQKPGTEILGPAYINSKYPGIESKKMESNAVTVHVTEKVEEPADFKPPELKLPGYLKSMDEDQLKECSARVEKNPGEADAYFERGKVYYSMKDMEKAIRDYDQAIKLSPNVAKYHYFRGGAYLSKKQDDLAIRDFKKAIKLDPKDETIRKSLDASQKKLGGFEFRLEYSRDLQKTPNPKNEQTPDQAGGKEKRD
jgi:tetratricopeptide (TPR) repeat protein